MEARTVRTMRRPEDLSEIASGARPVSRGDWLL